jgi:hypothetical protein
LLNEKAGHWARGVESALPADADPDDPSASLDSVSCATAGNCTAVGSYQSTGGSGGLLLTEKDGQWAAGVEAVLPENPGFDPVAYTLVSCVSAGNCTAVIGRFLLTETAGEWATGVLARLPSDADPSKPVEIASVSCASDGNCSAVGTYNLDLGRDIGAGEGLLLTKTSGKWRASRAVMPPDGPGEGVVLTSVSCASGGNCAAIGEYNINIDSCCGGDSVLLMEKAGTWRHGVKPRLGLSFISCPSPGNCVALSGGRHSATLLNEEAGKWRRGPTDVFPRRFLYPGVYAFSCASPGNCAAVGSYWDGAFDAHEHGFLLTEIAGRWTMRVKALPADSHLLSVSCASRGSCGAVGIEGAPVASKHGLLLGSTTKPCVVPDVKGETLPQARHSIRSRNCSVGTTEQSRSLTIAKGRVIAQKPGPGRRLPPGTDVNLEVSSGP